MQVKEGIIMQLAAKVAEDKRPIATALAREIVFMGSTLEKLKAHIKEHGPIEWYSNGKQQCWRESPATRSYTAMIPRYAALFKQLIDLLPEDDAEADELQQWLTEN